MLSEVPKLAPFFKAVAVYFVLLQERPGWQAALVKVLPVLALALYVTLHGCALQNRRKSLITGLLLSAGGDALLVWPALFLHGMAFFAVAHVAYITSFGFRPFAPKIAATLFGISGVVVFILAPGLNGALKVAVPAYCVVLTTMAWRAAANVEGASVAAVAGALGAVLFAVSDGLIGVHNFLTPLPYAQTLIMSTYYAAQLGIALSVLDMKEVQTFQIKQSLQIKETTEFQNNSENNSAEDTTSEYY